MIRLSVREMAQYLVSDEAARLQLLRERKFLTGQAVARARFYSESRNAIASYHRGALSREAIESRIVGMRDDARSSNPLAKVELLSNADVLERYLYYQGHRALRLAPPPAADLVRGEIEIRVRPSLFAIEDDLEDPDNDQRRLIFLELRDKASPPVMRAIAQLAFEAFRPVLHSLPPQAIQVVDVRHGFIVELQQAGSAIERDLAEACQTISALWPQLTSSRGQVARASDRQLSIPWDAKR